jgi:hypothetical protein
MQKILLLLIAISPISLMGMDKQIIPLGSRSSQAPADDVQNQNTASNTISISQAQAQPPAYVAPAIVAHQMGSQTRSEMRVACKQCVTCTCDCITCPFVLAADIICTPCVCVRGYLKGNCTHPCYTREVIQHCLQARNPYLYN